MVEYSNTSASTRLSRPSSYLPDTSPSREADILDQEEDARPTRKINQLPCSQNPRENRFKPQTEIFSDLEAQISHEVYT